MQRCAWAHRLYGQGLRLRPQGVKASLPDPTIPAHCRLPHPADAVWPVRRVFVINPASGGRQGAGLAQWLRARGESVADLRSGIPVGMGPLVACGGDGTAAAVLEAAHRAGDPHPVAVVPLGTGNDLARSLGWRGESPQAWIARLDTAQPRQLDRWQLCGPVERSFFNYLSLGIDAAVAWRFHRLRRQGRWYLGGSLVNRAVYACLGIEAMLRRRGGALLLVSIPSYAAGHRLHPAIRADDGRIDAFRLDHGHDLGLVLGNLRRARHLGSGAGGAWRLRRATPLQLDGEPCIAPPGAYRVQHAGTVTVLGVAAAQR
jgi:diacylglycerol kinase (ATP)